MEIASSAESEIGAPLADEGACAKAEDRESSTIAPEIRTNLDSTEFPPASGALKVSRNERREATALRRLIFYSESQVTVKLVPSEVRDDGTASSAPVMLDMFTDPFG
jgi:hypothetical protein